MDVFDLSEAQATYILDLQLRRLTKFSRIELENEKAELERAIEELRDPARRREAAAASWCPPSSPTSPRRTARPAHRAARSRRRAPATAASPLEIADDPCWVLLSSTGLLARTGTPSPSPARARRAKHDVVVGGGPHDRARGVRRSSPPPGGWCGSRRSTCRRSRRPTARPACRRRRASRAPTSTSAKGEEPVTSCRSAPTHRSRPRHRAGVVKRVTPETRPRATTGTSSASRTATASSAPPVADRRGRSTSSSSPPTPSCCASRRSRCAPGPLGRRHGRHQAAAGARVAFFGVVDPRATASSSRRRLVRRPARHRGRRRSR